MALPPPPPQKIPKPPAGITADGVPHFQRGYIGLDTAACLNTDGRECGGNALLEARMPLGSKVFVEAVVPIGFGPGALGNPTLGAHYVARIMKRMWLTAGGSIGLPLVDEDFFFVQSIPRAFWDAHLYYRDIVPITVRLDWEVHANIAEIRVQLHPSLWPPTPENDDMHGAFYHAAELQLGHDIGAGLRVQGVALGPSNDDYQFALEPFFAVRRDMGFLRAGMMMPLHEPLGPPFEESWGFKLAAGIHVD